MFSRLKTMISSVSTRTIVMLLIPDKTKRVWGTEGGRERVAALIRLKSRIGRDGCGRLTVADSIISSI